MVVETARELERLGGDLGSFLETIGIPSRTYERWVVAYDDGELVERTLPNKELSMEDYTTLRAQMKRVVHKRWRSYGLAPLWEMFKGKMRWRAFRMAHEVREEVKRERRNNLWRYEFTHRDVCYSLDFTELPFDLPARARRYLLKIFDEKFRVTLKRGMTTQKGVGVALKFVGDLFHANLIPLTFKFDREFAHEKFEGILVMHKVVPMPIPTAYPPANGKLERSNKDLQLWLEGFALDWMWNYDELQEELELCFEELDDLERPELDGKSRRSLFEESEPPFIPRELFFRDAQEYRAKLLKDHGDKIDPWSAWWQAGKATLWKYGLIRYSKRRS